MKRMEKRWNAGSVPTTSACPRRPKHLPVKGEYRGETVFAYLWKPLLRSCGSDRKKTPESFSSGFADILHCDHRVQFPVSKLPELGDFPKKPEEVLHGELFPKEVVTEARRRSIPSVAYTYSEPTTFYEYMFDTARLARQAGLKNVLVSNGYINMDPFLKLCRYLDAANVNLKSFDDGIYRRLNGGTLAPVLNTFKNMHRQGVWFEMTTLVVPT